MWISLWSTFPLQLTCHQCFIIVFADSDSDCQIKCDILIRCSTIPSDTNNYETKTLPLSGPMRDAPPTARFLLPSFANLLDCYRNLSGPSGPKCPQSVPVECPRKRGCPRECFTGCSGPGLRSVQKVSWVSPECPRHLNWYSRETRDTFWTLWSQGPGGPPRHAVHTQRGHSRDTSGPKGLRDLCRRPERSQALFLDGGQIAHLIRVRLKNLSIWHF